MILDISRHKFHEALLTLFIFTTLAVVRAFTLSDELIGHAATMSSPIAEAIMKWASHHPTITALAVAPIFMNTVLSLARSTVRTSLYPQSSMAAISLIALAVMGTTLTPDYPVAMLTALFTAQCLARLLYCFGPNSRYNKLFTAMLAAGILPLLNGAMAIVSLLTLVIVIIQRGTIRESIIALTGALLPTFTCSYIDWLAGGSFLETPLNIWEGTRDFDMTPLVAYVTFPRLVLFGYLLFMYLITTSNYLSSRTTLNNSARAAWLTLHVISIACVATSVFIPSAAPLLLICTAISEATMLPLMYQRIGDAWSATAYIAFIGLSFYSLWG